METISEVFRRAEDHDRAAAQLEQQACAMRKSISERIVGGDSRSGDPMLDYLIARHKRIDLDQVHRYRQINTLLKGHIGELVALYRKVEVVKSYFLGLKRKPKTRMSLLVGILTDDSLHFTTTSDVLSCTLPVARYADEEQGFDSIINKSIKETATCVFQPNYLFAGDHDVLPHLSTHYLSENREIQMPYLLERLGRVTPVSK